MKKRHLTLDDDLEAGLEAVCAEQGRDKAALLNDIVRKYLRSEGLKRALQDPELVALYERLSDEDVALAEEGFGEYPRLLEAADQQ